MSSPSGPWRLAMISIEELEPVPPRGVVERAERLGLLGLAAPASSSGWKKARHLIVWVTGHSASRRADVLAELEAERARARAARPAGRSRSGMLRRGEQRLAAIGLVEQHAVAGPAAGDLAPRPRRRAP